MHLNTEQITRPGTGSRSWLCWALAAAVVVAACADSDAGRLNPEAAQDGSAGTELANAPVSADTAGEGGESLPENRQPYAVVQASGYVRALLDAAGSGIGFDYQPLEGAGEAVAAMELIVAGYLVEIAPGVVWADTREFEPRTQVQIEARLQFINERESRLRDLGRLGPNEIATFERERQAALANQAPEPDDIVHAAYRIRVTEVLLGDFKVGDLLDVQVPLSVFTTLQELQAALKGTPRAVVGGDWSTHVWSNYKLQDANRAPLDEAAFYPWIEMFWLDESLWHPTGETPTLTTPVDALTERSAGSAEALYLRGLHDLHPAWGDLEGLDDLADAIRAAATPPDLTTTTTTESPTTTGPPTTCTAGCDQQQGG